MFEKVYMYTNTYDATIYLNSTSGKSVCKYSNCNVMGVLDDSSALETKMTVTERGFTLDQSRKLKCKPETGLFT